MSNSENFYSFFIFSTGKVTYAYTNHAYYIYHTLSEFIPSNNIKGLTRGMREKETEREKEREIYCITLLA